MSAGSRKSRMTATRKPKVARHGRNGEVLAHYLAQKGEPVLHYRESAIYCRCGEVLDRPGDRMCLRCEKLADDAMAERCWEEED